MFGGAGYYRKRKIQSIFGAEFDGTNDSIRNTSALTSSTDATWSFWTRPYIDTGNTTYIFSIKRSDNNSNSSLFHCGSLGSGVFRIRLSPRTNTGSGVGQVAYIGSDNHLWHHCVASYSYANDILQLAVDGVLRDTSSFTGVPFLNQGVTIGDLWTNNRKYGGDIALFWFDDEYVDLSVQANIDKFYSATNPVGKFGSNGQLPLGSTPLIFLKEFNDFQINLGSYSNFTVTGSLTQGAALP